VRTHRAYAQGILLLLDLQVLLDALLVCTLQLWVL
jgi:hypothetical protein